MGPSPGHCKHCMWKYTRRGGGLPGLLGRVFQNQNQCPFQKDLSSMHVGTVWRSLQSNTRHPTHVSGVRQAHFPPSAMTAYIQGKRHWPPAHQSSSRYVTIPRYLPTSVPMHSRSDMGVSWGEMSIWRREAQGLGLTWPILNCEAIC